MAIRAVTATLQAAVQNDTAGSLVALVLPHLNKIIHEMTEGDTAKDKAAKQSFAIGALAVVGGVAAVRVIWIFTRDSSTFS